jgi:outer membrane immunogenic protein
MSMRSKFLYAGLACVSALALTSAARAADLVQPAPSPVPPAAVEGFGWTGFYVGVGGGAGVVVHDLSSNLNGINGPGSGGNVDFNGIGGEGVFGQAEVGYDYLMTNRFLIGAFADARFGNIGPKVNIPGGSITAEEDYGFDVGARAGYLVTPTSLVYVLGGYSWQHFHIGSSPSGFIDYNHNSNGFIAGVGMETALRGNWSLKTEYRYAEYESYGFIPGGLLNDKPSSHTFHVALDYRFGGHAQPATFEAPVHNWTGFYVGGGLGAGGLVHDLSTNFIPGLSFNGIGAEGVLGEATVGYDQELGSSLVAGILADARISSISTDISANYSDPTPNTASGSGSAKADYGFDVLGKLGYKVDNSTLVYALGGYSWQHFKIDASGSINISGGPSGSGSYSYDWGSSGFTVGGGLETALSDRATVGLEYRYSQYGSTDFGTGGLIKDEPSSHTVRLNFDYKLF